MKSIQTRLTIWVFTFILCIFVCLFLILQNILIKSFQRTESVTGYIIQDSLNDMWDRHVYSMASLFADQLVRPVYVKDLQAIRALTMAMCDSGYAEAVFVLDENDIVLSDGTTESMSLGRVFDSSMLPVGEHIRSVERPILVGPDSLGHLILSLDKSSSEAAITTIHARTDAIFRRNKSDMLSSLGLLLASALFIGILASHLLAKNLVRPLNMLSRAIKKIGRYDYDVVLPLDRSDEIGQLARTLNHVARSLRKSTVSKAYLENILASMPVGVAITNREGDVLNSNPNFRAICESIGHNGNINSILNMNEADFGAMVQRLSSGDMISDKDIVIDSKDNVKDALLSGVPVNTNGSSKTVQFLFIIHDITERKGLERQLRHIAQHDHLTGLPNRRFLFETIQGELEIFRRRGGSRPFWLVFVDVDGFKSINDTYGHHVGDQILQAVSQRLSNASRAPDVVGRLAGDEFLILLRGDLSHELANSVAHRMLAALRSPVRADDLSVSISASIGLARSEMRHVSADEIIIEADAAMYEAKLQGKNRIVSIFDMDKEERKSRVLLEGDLRKAVQDHDITNHYQPIIRLPECGVVGFEALARWTHPARGPILPDIFIPAAQDLGLISDLGMQVLGDALEQCRDWLARPETSRSFVSVNVSVLQLEEEGFVQRVEELLGRSGVPPEMLVLELTESQLMRESEDVLQILHGLKKMGVRLAVDDFGTGYSSLSKLPFFPFDILKVDCNFIKGLEDNPDRIQMLRIIRDIGQSLNMEVVMEGVENDEQARIVHSMGIDCCQGFLYYTPLPGEDIWARMQFKSCLLPEPLPA